MSPDDRFSLHKTLVSVVKLHYTFKLIWVVQLELKGQYFTYFYSIVSEHYSKANWI